MEALLQEILASPRAGQAVVPTATPVLSSEKKAEEKSEEEEESKTVNEEETKTETEQVQHEREVAEWATEIEVQRLLEFGSGAYGDMTMGFDMTGVDMDMGSINMPVDLSMDMSGFEGVGMDMGAFDFDLSGVSPELDLLGMYTTAPASTAT
jgi:hypothetical protein